MENNRHSYSRRKILAVVLAVLIPVSLGGIFFILFTIKDTQRQEAEAMAASVESQVQRVSELLPVKRTEKKYKIFPASS